jgi:hypothetical protein
MRCADTRPVLVMIPGTLCDGRLFDRQARELRSQAQVVRVDWQHLRHSIDPIDALLRRLIERWNIADDLLEHVHQCHETLHGAELIRHES